MRSTSPELSLWYWETVTVSDFFTQEGVTYVRTKKGVFPVAEDVQCFNGAASGDQSKFMGISSFLNGLVPAAGHLASTTRTWRPLLSI